MDPALANTFEEVARYSFSVLIKISYPEPSKSAILPDAFRIQNPTNPPTRAAAEAPPLPAALPLVLRTRARL
jgi:hypothetical protein